MAVEAAKNIDDEGLIGDGGVNVVEGDGETLHLAGVLGDGHVALVQTVELLLREHVML
jgi:hypothetical protein